MQLYNNKEEIIASVFPKYGRVVVWNDTADFIFKPPSFNVEQAEYSLLIKVTEDQNKFQKHEEEFQVSWILRILSNKSPKMSGVWGWRVTHSCLPSDASQSSKCNLCRTLVVIMIYLLHRLSFSPLFVFPRSFINRSYEFDLHRQSYKYLSSLLEIQRRIQETDRGGIPID